ncbi:VCBS repeat-containing protein [candidate division KSB1 bacterium]|nr:VCBS repeat-containing protein [candidate division KSB1 bacterium]
MTFTLQGCGRRQWGLLHITPYPEKQLSGVYAKKTAKNSRENPNRYRYNSESNFLMAVPFDFIRSVLLLITRMQMQGKSAQGRRNKLVVLILLSTLLLPEPNSRSADLIGHPWKCHIIDDSSQGADGVKLADINGDGLMDIATGWEQGGITRIYLNPGNEKSTRRWPAVTVGKTPSVEDALFADLDGDGFTDVVSCCEGESKTIFVHWAPGNSEDFLIAGKWKQAILDASIHAQQWMFAWPMQVDGIHGIDLIAGSKGKNAQIGWFEAAAIGCDLSRYKWHPVSEAGWIMSIWKQDMDADKDIDIVISDRRGPLRGCRWLENPGQDSVLIKPWKNHFMGAEDKEVLSMVLEDLDGDSLQDAVVAVKDMKILILKRIDKSGLRWTTHVIPLMANTGNPRAVVVADVNQDGQKDLVLTTWNAEGKHGVVWLEYKKTPMTKDWLPHQISGIEKGIKYDRIEMLDLDGDGDLDLLTCEEREGGWGMGVFWYENPFCKLNEPRVPTNVPKDG